MKVKIGPYPRRLVCEIYKDYMNKKYGHIDWPENQTFFENCLEDLEDFIQYLYVPINYFLDKRNQKIKVKIDSHDTWSMDHTLSHIIVPMLKQLKETKHGAPFVDMEDRPEHLRCEITNRLVDVDPHHFEAWDWVLDEMIWTFEQKARDNWECDYYEYKEIEHNSDSGDFAANLGLKLVWEDKEGLKAHADRMKNGFMLFGKYYEALWD